MNRPINGNPADKDLLEMFQRFVEISFLVSACYHDALEYAALCRDIPEEIRRLKAFAAPKPKPLECTDHRWPAESMRLGFNEVRCPKCGAFSVIALTD